MKAPSLVALADDTSTCPARNDTAFEAFQLDYTVRFPLSLVISRKTIARYQILFRFLLQLRHAELQLSMMWTEHTTDDWRRRSGLSTFEAWKTRVFALRTRMLAFVQHMMAFVSYEVIEPNWRTLEDRLKRVTTVDQMLKDHVDFLDTCLKEAGLTKSELIAVSLSAPFNLDLLANDRIVFPCRSRRNSSPSSRTSVTTRSTSAATLAERPTSFETPRTAFR